MKDSILENPIFAEILKKYVDEAEKVFRREVNAQGIVLTGAMLNSIKSGAVERGKDYIKASVHYDMLLRLKDLKQLNFERMPPLSPFIKYVERVGVSAFPYIPGYPKGLTPRSYTATVIRIAEGLRHAIKKEPNVKRGYRGVYNDPLKNDILPKFFFELRRHAGAGAIQELTMNFSK